MDMTISQLKIYQDVFTVFYNVILDFEIILLDFHRICIEKGSVRLAF